MRGVDRQQGQGVHLIERAHEAVEAVGGASEAVRFEHDVDAAGAQARGGDGGAHLRRVVAVVLDHAHAAGRAMDGEAATHALAARERFQRRAGAGERHRGAGHQRVHRHVRARQRHADVGHRLTAGDDAGAAAVGAQDELIESPVAGIEAAADDAAAQAGEHAFR